MRTLVFGGLAAIVLTVTSGTHTVAQEPLFRALPQGALGTDGLGKLLREMGYDPKGLSPDVFQVTIDKERWAVHVMLSLSTDGQRVWLESKFAPVDEADRVPAAAWKRLLEANEKVGPAHFAFDPADRRVHLYKSFDNRQVDADRLKKEIAWFDETVRKTQEYWRSENFRPVSGPVGIAFDPREPVLPKIPDTEKTIPLLPPVKEAPLAFEPPAIPVSRAKDDDETRLLAGWTIAEIHVKGRKTPEAVVAERKPHLEFKECLPGLKAILKTGPESERTVKVRLDPAATTKQIDFIDEGDRVEKGIYRFDGSTLTVCFAAPGEPRPTEFKATDDSRTWMIVLRKK
jgi:uncharacterized protein (TIGR03067 family)